MRIFLYVYIHRYTHTYMYEIFIYYILCIDVLCTSATGNKKEDIMKTRVLGDGGDAAVPHSGQCWHFTGRQQRLTNPDKQWREPCGSCASRQQKLATELTSRGLHRKKKSLMHPSLTEVLISG